MNFTDLNDMTLVSLTLAGDQNAYGELVLRYQSAVIGAANRVIRSRYLAEDAAQDAFVTAWMKLASLKEPEKYGVWVCRIARNCALNMRTRFREYLSDEILDTVPDDQNSPEDSLVRSENNRQLHEGIDRLPKKIAEVIRLHYFEGLSISEIADRLRLSEGTVKWRLHDGRQRLREDLSAMNEKIDDTLVQKVMKKVAELKLWALKYDKKGFETVYADVLSDVESLPESGDKYNMMADVLVRGWWWIPGKENDELFARIRRAAELGHNEEVMQFVVAKEDSKVPEGKERNQWIREKQIPGLTQQGFVKTAAYEWFWLGRELHVSGDHEAGFAAYEKVRELLTPSDIYYANVLSAIRLEKLKMERQETPKKVMTSATAESYRWVDGNLRFWSKPGYSNGGWFPAHMDARPYIWYFASFCDKRFFFDTGKEGDRITDDNQNSLTYGGRRRVSTPAGDFDDCQLWITERIDGNIPLRYETYYAPGVGIVRQDVKTRRQTFVWLLKEETHVGGEGLLPVCPGNRWVYTIENSAITGIHEVEVIHADDREVLTSCYYHLERQKTAPRTFEDALIALRSDYVREDADGSQHLVDVRPLMAQVKALAKTPYQIELARLACDVMERILSTDEEFTSDGNAFGCDRTAKGLWNFFVCAYVDEKDGKWTANVDRIYSFEWKDWEEGEPNGVLCNFLYDIPEDALGGEWCEEFAHQQERVIRWNRFGSAHETVLKVTKVGEIATPAGKFEDCIELALNISDLSGGYGYRGGRKEYYLAKGVGIVKAVHHFEGQEDGVFELTEYEGRGEGYFPQRDGLRRKYEAHFDRGYDSAVEYVYINDDKGNLCRLADQTGIRKL
ncbi:MAG: RNA polymerase sigma factor [Eubacteriales bacterium]